MSLKHREAIEVAHPETDEQITVYNWVNVVRPTVIHGGTSVEYFELEIGAGDASFTPDYVTEWVAEDIYHEYTVEVEDYGIEVIDPTDEEVNVL
jgi:hypothetical protein